MNKNKGILVHFLIIFCYLSFLLNNIFEFVIISNGEFLDFGIELLCLVTFFLALFDVFRKGFTKTRYIVIYGYGFAFSADFVINDSIVGVTFLAILLFFVAFDRVTSLKIELFVNLVLEFSAVLEIFSIIILTNIMDIKSVIASEAQGFWVDVLFVIAVIMKMLFDEKKILKYSKVFKRMIAIASVVLVSFFVVGIGIASYYRASQYAISPIDGKYEAFYIVDANTGKYAVTCSDGWGVFQEKLDYSSKQRFKLEKAIDDSWQYIVADDGNVLDIVANVYTDANRICEYEASNTENQYWRIEPQDNGFYKIVSYNEEYFMTFIEQTIDEKTTTVAGITSNTSDVNQYVYFVNADLSSIPFVGWISMSNRNAIIVMYCAINVGVLFALLYRICIVKQKRRQGECL